jgi:enamine deaminase RidA (YjgF/YER057c/UK114 family)
MMARTLISSGSSFEAEAAYSRAVVDGDWIFVAGTTGFDYDTMTIVEGDVVAQCDQALANIDAALARAGGSMADVVRVHYLLKRREDFELCWPSLRRVFGDIRPASTMFVAGLAEDRMLIEIEVTARRRSQS